MTDSPRKDVPHEIAADLEILKEYYKTEKFNDRILFSFFEKQDNPFAYVLDLITYSHFPSPVKYKSTSFSSSLFLSLKNWSSFNKNLNCLITKEMKLKAVNLICKQNNGPLIEVVCKLYRVKDDWDYFKENQFVPRLISAGKLKEAYYIIHAVEAQTEFDLHEIVLPFFFLQKDSWIKGYLENYRDLQLEFIQILDSICQSSVEIQKLVRSLNIGERKAAGFTENWVQKRLAYFIELFDIDLKECPNLFHIRTLGAMNYLFQKRYGEESIGAEAWEELIISTVANNVDLQKELLIKLVCVNDARTALKLVNEFNLSEDDWPDCLRSADVSSNSRLPNGEAVDATLYLALRLDVSDVHIVDTPEKFFLAVEDIVMNYDVVAVDAEWRPNLGISKEVMSLMQLAVWDSVYLLDILTLKQTTCDVWDILVQQLFSNPAILKLGYGIDCDLKLLSKIFSDTSGTAKYSRVVDLGTFFTQVKTHNPKILEDLQISTESITNAKGLSQLCANLLGKPLDKREQFSDWERRPLRQKQVIYAALDSFCLLMIYERLHNLLQQMGINIDEFFEQMCKKPKSSANPKGNVVKENVHGGLPQRTYSSVSDFKVVVDNMLAGMGRHLRMLGVDVVLLDNDADHMDAVKIAQSEKRIILTNGAPYQKLKTYVPEGMCICVPKDTSADEQAAFVIDKFNIPITESDIFSRCMICNGNVYLKISSGQLYALWHSLDSNNSSKPSQNTELKPYIILDGGFITEKGVLHNGVPVAFKGVSQGLFERIETFLICSTCGRVYWEGCHFDRVKRNVSENFGLIKNPKGNVYQSDPAEATSRENNAPSTSSHSYISHFDDDSPDDDFDDIVYID